MITEKELEELGLNAAASKIKEAKELKRKIAVASEHYRYVRPEKIDSFNRELRDRTLRNKGFSYHYQTLTFVDLKSYDKIPPEDCLKDLKKAIERNCFDSFEVAHIVEVKEDPIIFGRINNCGDRFFITQWDNDVKIEDILKDGEG